MTNFTQSTLNILLTDSTDIYGGGEFFVLELAKALRGKGHHVWVSCRPGNPLREKCEQAGVPTEPLDFPTSSRHIVHFIFELKRIIAKNNITILHTNSNYDRTVGAFAAWRAGVPHVTNVHSLQSISYNLTHSVRNHLTDHFLADGVCAKEILVNKDHIPDAKVSVFYHGVNADEMRRDEQLRCSIKKEFSITDDQVLIGNVSRFVHMKGQSYLVEAFAKVVRSFPRARLMLVGDGQLYEEMVQLTKSLGVESQVIFPGYRSDLQALYSAFDIYAHSSVHGGGETISFAVQQALAQELPVVVTRAGDVPENVREGINGFVVPDRDANALAERLLLLLSDPARRASMGRESRKYLLERFTTERMVQAVEKVYRDVLKC